MITPENAKRLKGLGYVPLVYVGTGKKMHKRFTLSQLLREVERRGWTWELRCWLIAGDKRAYCLTLDSIERSVEIPEENEDFPATPEDAVALALISILEGERKKDDLEPPLCQDQE